MSKVAVKSKAVAAAPLDSETFTEDEEKAYRREMKAFLVDELNLDPRKAQTLVRGLVRVIREPDNPLLSI